MNNQPPATLFLSRLPSALLLLTDDVNRFSPGGQQMENIEYIRPNPSAGCRWIFAADNKVFHGERCS